MVDLALLQSVSYIAGALGVCIATIYYMINLRISQRNQELTLKALEQSAKAQELTLKAQQQNLETRQAQLFMGIYDKFCAPEFRTALKNVLDADVNNYVDFRKKIIETPEPTLMPILLFYEGVGMLVKENLMDIRLVAGSIGGFTLRFWGKVAPYIEQTRKDLDYHAMASETEYLCKRLVDYMKEHPDWM